jgi:molybdopterin converting factor small subunit
MAFLILKNRGPHGGPEDECFYEFDPSDGATIEKIEAAFFRNNPELDHREARLAAICGESMEAERAGSQKSVGATIAELFDRFFRARGRFRGRGSRRVASFNGNQFGSGRCVPGCKREISFV